MNETTSPMTKEEQIKGCEEQLLQAMRTSDLNLLDTLLHEDLLFNGPNGATATKADDLAAYRSGKVNFNTVTASGLQVNMIGDDAVVTVTVQIRGTYFDQVADGTYKYIRVWKFFPAGWKVIGGSCVTVPTSPEVVPAAKADTNPIANTPRPPYYAVIFTSLRTEVEDGYSEMADRMVELAAQQEGYLGIESARDGLGITVSYWRDLECIRKWRENVDHTVARKKGVTDWYSHFKTRVALVERDNGFVRE